MGIYTQAKQCALAYFEALERCTPAELPAVLEERLAPGYELRSVYPFRDVAGARAAGEQVWGPMKQALSHL